MPAKKFVIPFASTGDRAAVPDTLQPDGTVSYAQGFGPDYELDKALDPINAKDVPRDQSNQIYFDATDAIGEIQLYGAALWGADRAPYPLNARSYHDGSLWRSNVANNNGVPGVAGWDDVSAQYVTGQNIAVISSVGVTAWDVPAEIQSGAVMPFVQVVGGGGAGGGSTVTLAGQLSTGGGGAAGGTDSGLLDLTGVPTVTITIGAGGAGVVAGNGNSGSGSSFGPYLSATGGAGGITLAAGTSGTYGQGGTPSGIGSGGEIRSRGVAGLPGWRLTGNDGHSGMGGASQLSSGGPPVYAQAGGNVGVLGSGGGGSLSLNGGGFQAGGAGGNGILIIRW